MAGIFYLVFHKLLNKKFKHRKVTIADYPSQQVKTEIKWSLITTFIFAVIGAATTVAWQKGYTAFYTDVDLYGYGYLFISLIILMLIHETYYYWIHRWMHLPKIFKAIHKVHHNSHIPSPWTAFSFHPIEGLLEGLILPLMLFVVPVHYITLLAYLTIMTISSVVNHLNIEIYPKNKGLGVWTNWLIGASHHSLHHTEFRYNYGLYFTIWDKLAQTESPNFKSLFSHKTKRKN
jgi:sterol desaturase/sphingolipid hydroxylase (fatty acid hydroxylase superfamily)